MRGKREVFTPANDKLEKLVDLAISHYERESAQVPLLTVPSRDTLRARISSAIDSRRILACLDSGELAGYMLLSSIERRADKRIARMPLWGFAAAGDRADIASGLLTELLERTVCDIPTEYEMNIFANERQNIVEWAYDGFGVRSINSLVPLDHDFGTPQAVAVTYLECDTRFLNRNKEEIIDLLCSSSNRSEHSPMFREHRGITRDQYREMLFDPANRTVVASRGGEVIGAMVLTRPDGELLLRDGMRSLGELYVRPECRGEGVSRGLFRRAVSVMKRDGDLGLYISYDSADPRSRPLRDGTLTPCSLTLTRTIIRPS